MKSNLTQKGYYRNTSKIITSRLGGGIDINFSTTKNTWNKKFSFFNTNLNMNNQNSKKKIKFNGFYFKNIDSYNLLSNSSSKNLKKNFICNNLSTKNNNKNNNNQKLNNRIKHYQYINYKNKNPLKYKNMNNKKSCSLSNSNSIFNNFHK